MICCCNGRNTPSHPVKLWYTCTYGDGAFVLSRDVTVTLEQAEAMRRDFVANVSHEIRTHHRAGGLHRNPADPATA